jgi:hypothetical protein
MTIDCTKNYVFLLPYSGHLYYCDVLGTVNPKAKDTFYPATRYGVLILPAVPITNATLLQQILLYQKNVLGCCFASIKGGYSCAQYIPAGTGTYDVRNNFNV